MDAWLCACMCVHLALNNFKMLRWVYDSHWWIRFIYWWVIGFSHREWCLWVTSSQRRWKREIQCFKGIWAGSLIGKEQRTTNVEQYIAGTGPSAHKSCVEHHATTTSYLPPYNPFPFRSLNIQKSGRWISRKCRHTDLEGVEGYGSISGKWNKCRQAPWVAWMYWTEGLVSMLYNSMSLYFITVNNFYYQRIYYRSWEYFVLWFLQTYFVRW